MSLQQQLLSSDKRVSVQVTSNAQVICNHQIKQSQRIHINIQQHAQCRLHVTDQLVDAAQVEFHITLEQDAQLHMVMMLVHATQIECAVHLYVKGSGAHADIKGAYALADQQRVTINTYQYHDAENTKSTLVMKGILQDKAQVDYQGLIKIEEWAKGTYASQQNQNIVLSKDAKVVSIPSIEVLEHDVQCFHGSAIGKFDEQQLWYLQSKGLSYQQAYKLLVQSFFQDVLDGVDGSDEMLGVLCQKINVA